MQNIFKKQLIAVVVFALFVLLPVHVAWAAATCPEKVLFVDEPYPPYILGEVGSMAEEGITIDFLRELFSRMKIDVNVQLMPWARALKTLEYGKADGVALLIPSEERGEYLAFTDKVLVNQEVICYLPQRHADFSWQNYESLEPYTIGLVRGYVYGADFMKASELLEYKIVYSSSSEKSLELLLAGRVDLIVEDETTFKGLVEKHPEWKALIACSAKPVSTYDWCMGISRKSPLVACMDAINATLAAMRADGTLDALFADR